MAGQEESGGIAGHLQYWSYSFDDSNPFMQIHLDTMLLTTFIALGLISFALWLRCRLVEGAPTGVQNFMESVIDFINQTVRDNFSVNNPLIAPLAMTIFVFILLCNSLDILPAYLMHHVAGLFGLHHFRQVPTNDLNLPAAMAVSVFLLVLYYEFKLKPGHFLKELLLQPFAALLLDSKNPVVKVLGVILIPLNLTLKLVEEFAKPLSLSFRLFGNMFAGEVIFLLIASLLLVGSVDDISSVGGVVSGALGLLVGLGWSLFHMFIGLLQAFIFMILSVVYLSIAHQPVEH
ncbi:MAG: ATP synthase F0 subunit A [Zetaproteobacteria bacterium CG12_big_fil_rev_8_21_14_0_65_54_13]|nr:MAG: ATP synthase F0 subunit A [Zetaproteobacteria bacterium CG23_combo_of_CG06-09_8_20_14_all_54_7]PIW51356.1 MAG: ATP synthase F0 subunit A [Zetaproteobacteria bacterium CG12_big_fil_rev_8_21_14_0_65_54_13]PIX54125.1 MAG: ATP synthase F0 subunit A [Zetaproteobacteria bacterium CG_4_10_14_3_um_filter_54_28]PJA31047.1 MAG: ATP synthase F0 subunit A [Zetaproteobacteria bacterium CG_4_9_14_3_um_filter_54_145]